VKKQEAALRIIVIRTRVPNFAGKPATANEKTFPDSAVFDLRLHL